MRSGSTSLIFAVPPALSSTQNRKVSQRRLNTQVMNAKAQHSATCGDDVHVQSKKLAHTATSFYARKHSATQSESEIGEFYGD